MKQVDKKCQECGEKLIGRVDKKFCSDQCRISFNNRLNSDSINHVRNVNNILRKNRRILEELNTTGKSRVAGDKLKTAGLNFNYFTSIYTTKDGAMYKFCYEQGYLEIEKGQYLLVVKKD